MFGFEVDSVVGCYEMVWVFINSLGLLWESWIRSGCEVGFLFSFEYDYEGSEVLFLFLLGNWKFILFFYWSSK